ncbi:hypothetical protein ABIE27_003700 [Paenibacillus sp. 4624]|jgi:hypothetical protein
MNRFYTLLRFVCMPLIMICGQILDGMYYALFESRYLSKENTKEDLLRILKKRKYHKVKNMPSPKYYLMQVGFYLLFSSKRTEKWFDKILYKEIVFEGVDKNIIFSLKEMFVETDRITNITLSLLNTDSSEFIIKNLNCILRINNKDIKFEKIIENEDLEEIIKMNEEKEYYLNFEDMKREYLMPSNMITIKIEINKNTKNRRFIACDTILEQQVPIKVQEIIDNNISLKTLFSFLSTGGYFLIAFPLSLPILTLAALFGGKFILLLSVFVTMVLFLIAFYLNRRFTQIYWLLQKKKIEK